MLDIEKAVAKVLDNHVSAVHAKDVGANARLYDPKVRVFDAWGVWSNEGLEAWQRAVEAWFTSLGTERVKVTFEDVKSAGTAECAVVSAIVTYAGLSSEGKPLRAMQNRMTFSDLVARQQQLGHLGEIPTFGRPVKYPHHIESGVRPRLRRLFT